MISIKAFCLKYVDLPDIFGPVINLNRLLSFSFNIQLLAIKLSVCVFSTDGCLPFLTINSELSLSCGLTAPYFFA